VAPPRVGSGCSPVLVLVPVVAEGFQWTAILEPFHLIHLPDHLDCILPSRPTLDNHTPRFIPDLPTLRNGAFAFVALLEAYNLSVHCPL